jgi:2'-5' RNA ligase
MIFPEFENVMEIERIRQKYDPLINHVKPHITLVFPFRSYIEKYDLQTYIVKAISEISPFKLKMGGISGQSERYGNFIFLI